MADSKHIVIVSLDLRGGNYGRWRQSVIETAGKFGAGLFKQGLLHEIMEEPEFLADFGVPRVVKEPHDLSAASFNITIHYPEVVPVGAAGYGLKEWNADEQRYQTLSIDRAAFKDCLVDRPMHYSFMPAIHSAC